VSAKCESRKFLEGRADNVPSLPALFTEQTEKGSRI